MKTAVFVKGIGTHAPCGWGFLPAWREVSTTSTLEWERQPEEKGMAMNRRGGCCSLLLMAPPAGSPAFAQPSRAEPDRRCLALRLAAGASRAEQIAAAGQVASLYSSGKGALGPHARAAAPRWGRPATGRPRPVRCREVAGDGREASGEAAGYYRRRTSGGATTMAYS